MTTEAYRFYKLDQNGKMFAPPAIVECADDDEAVLHGQTLAGECAIEIWQLNRRVAVIPVDQSAS